MKIFNLENMFQRTKNLLFILLLLVSISSCQKKKWTVTQYSSTKIAIDSTTEVTANEDYKAFLQPFKEQIAKEMNVVIGQSAQTMPVSRPESLLSNFCADVFRTEGSAYLKKNVDIGIVNIGGLRTEIPKGDITIGKIFELMPFENEIVILWLKGDKLIQLCHEIASVGGEGISGIKLGMEAGQAVSLAIDGKALDIEKTYIIVTNDYLAEGNDKLEQLAEYEKLEKTGIKVRDMLIDYIKSETKKGNKIKSQLDGRIYEIK